MSKTLIFDTETTGLSFTNDEILQLSIIDDKENVVWDKYYQPSHVKDWSIAFSINGISKEMVKDKPFITEDLDEIQRIFDDADMLVAYNIDFDLNFLKAIGINFKKDIPHYDVMKIFADIYGEWNPKRGCNKWQKLTKCAEYYNFDWSKIPAHNSLGDCYATLHCFKEINKKEK